MGAAVGTEKCDTAILPLVLTPSSRRGAGAAHPKQALRACSEDELHGTALQWAAFCISNTITPNAQLSLPEEPMEKKKINSFPFCVNTLVHISASETKRFSAAVRASQARLSKGRVEEASKGSSSSLKPGYSIYATCLEIWVTILRF